jgi:hypothetical protein
LSLTRVGRAARWAFLGAGLWVACGDAAERFAADPRAADLPARFGGSVQLQGALAEIESGSLFLFVSAPGSRSPTLARKYEIGDPAFSTDRDERRLRFALDERDCMIGASAPMFEEMEVEARFDPDGVLDTDEGVVRASVRARPGDGEISIAVPSGADARGKAPASPPVAGSPKDS